MIFKNWILVSAILAVFLFPIAFPLMIDDNPTLKASSQISSNSADKINSLSGSDDLNKASPRYSVASEEEDIDDFTVSPESGRWETTTTGAVDSRIIEGNLRTITTENTTAASSEYFMQRGLQSSDDKIDYRYKALMDNSSQVEYFASVLGDSADFEESDTEGFFKLLDMNTLTSTNGLLTGTIVDGGSTLALIRYNFNNVNLEIYKSIKFSIRASNALVEWRAGGLGLVFEENGNVGSKYIAYTTLTGTIGTSWINYEISFSDFTDASTTNTENMDLFTFGFEDVEGIVYIDNIELIGDLDYATHSEGAVEDTWDWEDSNEYAFDELGDAWDGNEGDTESLTGVDCELISNLNSEYLMITSDFCSDTESSIGRSGLSIDASTYKYLAVEFYSNISITKIDFRETGLADACTDSTGWTTNTWHLFTCTLNASWSGTETAFILDFNHASGIANITINMVYLYDQALGDVEGWDGSGLKFNNYYVNPEGYYTFGHLTGLSSDTDEYTGLNIDTTIFDTLKISLREYSGSDGVTFQLYARETGGGYGLVWSQAITQSSSFTTYSFDLGSDSDWNSNIDALQLYYQDISGNFEGDEILQIDYILLQSSTETAQDFTLGFWDQDNSQALVNISHVSIGTDYTNYSDSSTAYRAFQWQIELYDSNQEVASYYYSANQTIEDIYYRAQISYNWLQAEFEVKMNFDNGTRIFSADLFDEFTITNQLAKVFSFGKIPDFFISTYTVYYGHQENWIDYINAPYKIQEWRNTLVPSWSNVTNNWQQYQVEEHAESEFTESTWRLNVPYLDSVSGELFIQTLTNDVSILDADEHNDISFRIYSVNAITGTLTQRVRITIYQDDTNLPKTRIIHPSGQFESDTLYNNITVAFSVAISQDRTKLTTHTAIDLDNYDSSVEVIQQIQDIVISGESNEFVLEVNYDPFFTTDTVFVAGINSFTFVQKDLFGDVGNFVGGIFGGVADLGGNIVSAILQGLADLLFGIFLPLILWIGGIVTGVGTFFANAIIDSLGPLLSSIISAVGGIVGPIVIAIADIAAAVGTAVWSSLTSVLGGFFDDIITLIVSGLTDIWNDILVPIIDLTVSIFGTIIDGIFTVIIPLIGDLWDQLITGILSIADPTGNLKIGIDNLVSGFSDFISSMLDLLTALLKNAFWFFMLLLFLVITVPFLANRDKYGNFNTPGVINDIWKNSTKTINIPGFQVLGVGTSSVVGIPLFLIIFVGIIILVAAGSIPNLLGGLGF